MKEKASAKERVAEGKVQALPNPEVDAKPKRRQFTAAYKLDIVDQADRCKGSETAVGELLRREGLYSSNLTTWRQQRETGALQALGKRRGRKPTVRDKEREQLAHRVAKLEQENAQLRAIIEIQKKVSGILEIPLNSDGNC